MLPRNIDLTEHRDFGDSNNFIIEQDSLVGVYLDDELMTPSQYAAIERKEKLFGRKRHCNEKNRVFDKETPFIEKSKSECQRCGKKLYVPWENFYGLCKDCYDHIEYNTEEIPWKIYKSTIRRIGDRGQGDLFELR